MRYVCFQMEKYLHSVDTNTTTSEGQRRRYIQESAESADRGTDYLTTGSVLGELALLSGKATECLITCETSVQMYKIPYEAIQAALELFTEEPSLEYRLWRVCAIRLATNILRVQPHFLPWTNERIKLHLEKCILYIKKIELPEGGTVTAYPVFEINSIHMSDIVLAHGVVKDPDGGNEYVGPCYIPIKIDRLILIVSNTIVSTDLCTILTSNK